MKTKHYVLLILAVLTAFIIGLLTERYITDKPPVNEEETKVTTVDTIMHHAPIPKSAFTSGVQRYTLPIYRMIGGVFGKEPRQDSIGENAINESYISSMGTESRGVADSSVVDLPIIQRHYADTTYEAWISGPVDPRLDSVKVYVTTTTVTRREWKPPKRWHIGISAGYGYGTKGFQPYIGVGITYSIISF